MSVAAPTPSSAVLHAGIVNGGGVLLIRFAPVLGVSLVATALAVAGGMRRGAGRRCRGPHPART